MKVNLGKQMLLLAFALVMAACTVSPVSPDSDSEQPVTDGSIPEQAVIIAPSLTQFDMIDENVGWGQAEGMILRTEDGGATWIDITPPDISIIPLMHSPHFWMQILAGC